MAQKAENKDLLPLFFCLVMAVLIGLSMGLFASLFVKGGEYILSLWTFLGASVALHFVSKETIALVLGLFFAAVSIYLVRRFSKMPRYHGPADSILVAHVQGNQTQVRDGLWTTLVAFLAIGGGAPVGQYGPLVHFGAVIGGALKGLVKKIEVETDVVLGCGVAAAISAGFHAPLAGVVFAHEVILRHLSFRAIMPITVSSVVSLALNKMLFESQPLFKLEIEGIELTSLLMPLFVSSLCFGLVAVIFMRSLLYFNTLGAKIGGSPARSLSIAFLGCLIIGLIAPEVMGLGSSVIKILLSDSYSLIFVAFLLILKILATSVAIGFGMFGGVFSPALFLGACTGAILTKIFAFFGFVFSANILGLAGMAAVSACVVGAPISLVIIILELTQSYELAVLTMLSTAVSVALANLFFGHSLFDEQLFRRGFDVSLGRVNLALSQMKILDIVTDDFVKIQKDTKIIDAIDIVKKSEKSECYCLDENGSLIGKSSLNILLGSDENDFFVDHLAQNPIQLDKDHSLLEALEIASKFVGESIPVTDGSSKVLLGVVTEADIFSAYLNVQHKADSIEH